jgi:hypothetical protein
LTQLNGVFDATTPYTGAGPEVDAAWNRITNNGSSMCRVSHYTNFLLTLRCGLVRIIRLSDEELRKVYKDGRASDARYSEEDGGGSMGALNMVHQIHCVVRTLFAILNGHIEFTNNVKNFFRKYTS